MKASSDREAGFTLIEVLVSIALLAFMLTAIYQSIIQIASASSKIEIRRHATALASAMINSIPDPSLEVPVREGRNLRPQYSWRLTISAILFDDPAHQHAKSLPYRIQFKAMTLTGGNLIELETIHLGSNQAREQ